MVQNPKILILSVLKPVNDIRNYHKIGKTLAKNGFDVIITGFGSLESTTKGNIFLKPIYNNNRIHWSRFLVSFKVLSIFIKTKPNVLLVSSIELMPIALLLKLIFKKKIIDL